MPDEVEAFPRCEELQRDGHQLDDLIEITRARGSQKRLELCKRELDRIEVRTVGRQESEVRAHALDRDLDLRLLVHRQVVEDDDVPRAQRRDEHLLDIGEERRIVDRPVEDGGRAHAIDP